MSLRGRVVDGAGRTVTGADIVVWIEAIGFAPTREAQVRYGIWQVVASSGADGTYALTFALPDLVTHYGNRHSRSAGEVDQDAPRLMAFARGRIGASAPIPLRVLDVTGGPFVLPDLVVGPAPSVRVSVNDRRGRAIGDARSLLQYSTRGPSLRLGKQGTERKGPGDSENPEASVRVHLMASGLSDNILPPSTESRDSGWLAVHGNGFLDATRSVQLESSVQCDVVLEDGRSARGRVIGADNVPVGGLKIYPAERDPTLPWSFEPLALTQVDGTFSVSGLPMAACRLSIEAGGPGLGLSAARALIEVPNAGDRRAVDLGDVRLGERRSVRGFVRDQMGRPVPGCDFYVFNENGIGSKTVARADGSFEFADILDGTYRFEAQKETRVLGSAERVRVRDGVGEIDILVMQR